MILLMEFVNVAQAIQEIIAQLKPGFYWYAQVGMDQVTQILAKL